MKLKIVTATKTLLEMDNVFQVNVPGINGILGILPGHVNLLTPLQTGQIVYKLSNGVQKRLAVRDGFVKVKDDEVMVLAGEAETADNLVMDQIEASIKNAEEKIADTTLESTELIKLEKQLRFERFKKLTLEQSSS